MRVKKIALALVIAMSMGVLSNVGFAANNTAVVVTDSKPLSIEQMAKAANISKSELQKQMEIQKKLSGEVEKDGLKILNLGKTELEKAKKGSKLASLYPKEAEKQKNVRTTALAAASNVLGTYGDILVTMNYSTFDINFGSGHAGIVSNKSGYTVESFPEDGVQYRTNNWKTTPRTYALYAKGASGTQYKNAATYAANQIGKKFNWNFLWKYDTAKFYCSQLVWRSWQQQGIDVDYLTYDTIVSPAELTKSSNTVCYYYKS